MQKLSINFIILHADDLWAEIRWREGIKCVDCGSSGYYKLKDGRYKCKDCGRIYSDTTNTLLHHSKLPKWKWIWALYKMSSSKGVSNKELSLDIGVDYHTAHLLQHKVRYLMNQDGYKLSGKVCMDEAYLGGWVGMHFNRKMDFLRKNHFIVDEGKRYEKKNILAAVSKKKFHIVSLVDSEGRTKILHTPNPITKDIIEQILERYTEKLDLLVTDESRLYSSLKGIRVESSNHSKNIFMTSGGHTSNPCENRFSWVKRKWNGIYTHTSEKYLQLYLNQMAFTVTYKDSDRFKILLGLCSSNKSYVPNNTILNFNYLEHYNFRDVYKEELEQARKILDGNCLVSKVTTKHGIILHR